MEQWRVNVLKSIFYKVHEAATGSDAFQAITNKLLHFDAVLIELNTEKNSLGIAAKIKRFGFKGLIIGVVSRSSQLSSMKTSIQGFQGCGIDKVLSSPLAPQEFLDVMGNGPVHGMVWL